MRFSVSPRGGASGWAEWLRAMRLVARLPAGVPPEFRRKLWLTLAEQHLKVKGVDWEKAEKNCFSEWTNPDDTELGVQIVKDLHRTGCSLFCGSEGRENQAVLKRVLLAYARWNKAVGYCQGFNMLAALILEVMDRCESDSLKVMIYLIEAVLPEGYFANNLRGLSVDMAVFRDLLRLRLPRLSAHLDKLQKGAGDGSCYEPPLTNVFTMQWFLTLFCNCLPRGTVLRVWDLVFLEGDEVLLTTALAIWDTLQDRILLVNSADEFYSVMGELARETLEAPAPRSEELLVRAARLGPVPELPRLRDKHRYNIAPWAHTVQSAAKKGLRLFYSEDETDSSDEGDKLALTTAYGLQSGGRGRGTLVAAGVFGHPDRERLALDISSLKQQYARLRERQRQAHIILAAACARQPHGGSPSSSGPMSVNHLLLGKNAIVSSRGRRLGPPQGAVPPTRTPKPSKSTSKSVQSKKSAQVKNETLHWKDENEKKTVSRRDSIKWKDVKQPTSEDGEEIEDPEEEGKQISESEINEIMETSMRSRRRSESSSYSECSESSTSTSLCDEPNRMSDFDSEPISTSDNLTCDEITKIEIGSEKKYNEEYCVQADDKSPTTEETNNTEFGNYIQEFEELLVRTNNLDNDKGLICVLPNDDERLEILISNNNQVEESLRMEGDKVETVKNLTDLKVSPKEDVIFITDDVLIESDPKTSPKQENIEIINAVSDKYEFKISPKEEITVLEKSYEKLIDKDETAIAEESVTECSTIVNESANEEVPENDFVEFVDSNRGKPLRNYLDEFRKADKIVKQEIPWETAEPIDFNLYSKMEHTSSFTVLECENKEDKQPFIENSEGFGKIADIPKANESFEEAINKPFSFSDYRSTSCDRSISSSISSISPILRVVPGFSEDKQSFTCYKSPCRVDSDAASELSEDEKPIILKIDKYFEHSPEFFGARKSGTYLSSDEEDDRYITRMKKDNSPILPRKPEFLALHLSNSKHSSEKKLKDHEPSHYDSKLYRTDKKYIRHGIQTTEIKTQKLNTFDEFMTSKNETSPYKIPSFVSPDAYSSIKMAAEKKSPLPVKSPIKHDSKDKFDVVQSVSTPSYDVAEKSNESMRLSILGKTKSEELPNEPKRSFSILDDEIEAIRCQSGRRNSERALKIIQENSKILHRILINQVNKTSIRDSFQEEICEGSQEEINLAGDKRSLTISAGKLHKTLASPRSASLDDDLPKRNYNSFAKDIEKLSIELESKRQVESIILSPLNSYKSKLSDATDQERYVPKKDYSMLSPLEFTPINSYTEVKEVELKTDRIGDLKILSQEDENKTDMFGWENKGFSVNQRIATSVHKDELTPSKPIEILNYIDNSENVYSINKESNVSINTDNKFDSVLNTKISEISSTDREILKISDVQLHLKPLNYFLQESPDVEKDSTLTAVSEVFPEASECSNREFTESWKVENNNSITDSFNLSPPNKFTYKSTETSSCIDNSFKNLRKYSDSPLSRVNDTFSRVTECSPMENISRPDGSKFETSQSSDVCVVSSSMSFSFDPSVDEQPSSKPATFNSSDTLCQLTSLDQVSTPISPKVTSYSLGKDSGVSQRDLSLELDRFRLTSEDPSLVDSESAGSSALRTPTSPGHDRARGPRSPEKPYSPFPLRTSTRQPKELGLRLGLYRDPLKSPSK